LRKKKGKKRNFTGLGVIDRSTEMVIEENVGVRPLYSDAFSRHSKGSERRKKKERWFSSPSRDRKRKADDADFVPLEWSEKRRGIPLGF